MDMSFEEYEKMFDSRYEKMETILGEGTYGKVYLAITKSNGQSVAMKKMKLDSEEEGVPSTAIREVAVLKEISHENVVKLLDVFCSTNKLVLVFEYVDNDLKKYMRSVGCRLLPATVRDLSHQLMKGIEFCHASRVLHRDLKPQNLLINKAMCLKIADFGLARAYQVPVPKYTHEVVTVWYRAPEILLGSMPYSIPVDIWSVGCIVAEMATGAPLFNGDSEIDTIFKVFKKLGTPTVAMWPELDELPEWKPTFPKWATKPWREVRNTYAQVGDSGIDLLDKVMVYDPRKRISARTALRHQYFTESVPGASATEASLAAEASAAEAMPRASAIEAPAVEAPAVEASAVQPEVAAIEPALLARVPLAAC